jgi:hypothetical protein
VALHHQRRVDEEGREEQEKKGVKAGHGIRFPFV